MLIDWFLPGYRAGGPTRSCANLIDHLSNDVCFSVITRDTDYMSEKPYRGVKSNEWNQLPGGTRVYYFSEDRLSKRNVYDLLKSEEYDFVYLNGIFSKYFTIIPLQFFRGKKNARVIVASRGMLAESALAIKKLKKSLFLLFSKQIGLFKNIVFHATNEEEAKSVRKVFGKDVLIQIAPNLTEKSLAGTDTWREKMKSSAVLRLVSVARIAPEKNIKYAIEVLGDVKSNVEFDLYGPVYDEIYWSQCQEVIGKLPSNIRVNFKDSIDSKMVSGTISEYDFLFLPTQGENFGHVILQSMRVGVPVIVSDQTMWRDLQSKNAGWDIELAEVRKFVDLIDDCANMSQADYARFSKGAFDFALAYVNNKESVEQNRKLFLKS